MATVALVGAKGNLGYMFLPELVESSAIKKIHCISRRAEKSDDPKVEWFQVDYEKPESVEKALKGCEVLINLMGTQGAYEKNKHTLVDMAAKAGVKFYIPSSYGVDVYVESDAVNHQCWNGKKEDDKYAQSIGLHVIPICVGLFMEHPAGGFMVGHGFMAHEQTWYMPGTGNTPLTMTSKKDIARSTIEIIKIAMSDPKQLKHHYRIAGTNKTPKQIVDLFNKAAKGKTHLKLELLSDEEADALMKKLQFVPMSEFQDVYDLDYMNEVASRVFRMSGGTGNLDFSKDNDNEIVNPGESKWKWKTMEEFAEEVDGMPYEF